jgi:hypothetical protein
MPKRLSKPLPASADEAVSLILAEIEAQGRAWTEFVRDLSTDQLMTLADGPWTVIDCLVHITAWIENALSIARLQANPDAPDPGPHRGPAGYLHINVDQFNAEVFQTHQHWPPDRALRWSDQVNTDLREALASLPPKRVLGGAGRYGARMWFWMPAFIHSRGHRRRAMRQLLGKVNELD